MTEQTIAPGEAWTEVERLKINISHLTNPCEFGQWYATAPGDKWELGWGDSPLEAVGNLLERIAAAKTMARPGIQNGLAKLGELEAAV